MSKGMRAIAFGTVALWSAVTLAADQPLRPPPKPVSAPATASGNVFAPPDAACLEWTDGCRVCLRPSDGDPTCSNIGIACTPQAPRCTRR